MQLRYFVDDKVFDSADLRKLLDVSGKDASDAERDRVCAVVEKAFAALERAGASVWRSEINGDGEAAMAAIVTNPSMHMKMEHEGAPDLEGMLTKGRPS